MDENELNNQERRKNKRIAASVVVEYSSLGGESSKEDCFMKNISLNGICIVAREEISLDDFVSLKIYLPGSDDPIEVKGKIVWVSDSDYLTASKVRRYDLGIEYVDLDEVSSDRISQHIAQYPCDES